MQIRREIIYKDDNIRKQIYCPKSGEFLGYYISTPSYETQKYNIELQK